MGLATCSCIVCNLFLYIAWLLFSVGASKSVMLWAFNTSHISPNPMFPIWKPIWSTAVLCRKYYLLVKDWRTFAVMCIIFYYYIFFSPVLNIETPLRPGVTPITVFLSVRPSVGIRQLKKLWYFIIIWHYFFLWRCDSTRVNRINNFIRKPPHSWGF